MTRTAKAFTLIELLVVIGIIALLIGLLIPVVNKVQTSGHIADSRNLIAQLESAIERYHSDLRAYPGPLSNDQVGYSSAESPPGNVFAPNPPFNAGSIASSASGAGFDIGTTAFATAAKKITMSENLVLGLLGGLRVDIAGASATLVYDPALVGQGPRSLSTVGVAGTASKRRDAYLDPRSLSWRDTGTGKTGLYSPSSIVADDTIVPEFVDRFPDPMPVLYLRARVGVPQLAVGVTPTAADNGIITYDTSNSGTRRVGQYDLHQIKAYTIGPGQGLAGVDPAKSMVKSQTGYQYPYDAYPYFTNPGSTGLPRNKDRFILISAGADRLYGTDDDICNFGAVLP